MLSVLRSERTGAYAGLLAVLLTVISVILTSGDMPDFIDGSDKIVAYYTGNPGKLIGGYILLALGTALLLVFAGGLYVRFRGVESGTLAPAGLGAAVAMCAMFMVYDAVNLAAAFRADEDGSIAPEVATALNDLGFLALGVGATMFAGIWVACTCFSGRISGKLPAWLAYGSLLLALGLMIPPIAWIFLPVLLAWVVLVSIYTWRTPIPAGATAAADE